MLITFAKSRQLRAEGLRAVRVVPQHVVWHKQGEMHLGGSEIPEGEQLAVVSMPCCCC